MLNEFENRRNSLRLRCQKVIKEGTSHAWHGAILGVMLLVISLSGLYGDFGIVWFGMAVSVGFMQAAHVRRVMTIRDLLESL